MKRSRPVSLALLGLSVWVSGCVSWTPIEVAEIRDYGSVRVTLTDGRRETLSDPNVTEDSISGYVWEGRPLPEVVRRDLAIDDVSEVQVKDTDVAATVVLAVLVGGAIAISIGIGSTFP